MTTTDDQAAPEQGTEVQPLPFATFLETRPPSQMNTVTDLWVDVTRHSSVNAEISAPDLQLYCDDESCNGIRYYRYESGDRTIYNNGNSKNAFLHYVCANCQRSKKMFAIYVGIDRQTDNSGVCYKFGEYPAFGPPTPGRLLRLLKKDREIFLKGRRCEAQGLGIGAFVQTRCREPEEHDSRSGHRGRAKSGRSDGGASSITSSDDRDPIH